MVNVLSEQEIRDMFLASAGVGLAFAIMFFAEGDPVAFLTSPRVVPGFVAAAALTAASLIPRVMAQRSTARVFEAYAEFQLWRPGVVIAVLTSFLGWAVAIPGGIRMYQVPGERYGRHELHLTPKDIGRVGLVGPWLNIALAVIFASFATAATLPLYGADLLTVGSKLNAVLALAAMVPVHPMDGYKVLRYNEVLWFLTVGLAALSFVTL